MASGTWLPDDEVGRNHPNIARWGGITNLIFWTGDWAESNWHVDKWNNPAPGGSLTIRLDGAEEVNEGLLIDPLNLQIETRHGTAVESPLTTQIFWYEHLLGHRVGCFPGCNPSANLVEKTGRVAMLFGCQVPYNQLFKRTGELVENLKYYVDRFKDSSRAQEVVSWLKYEWKKRP